ncbi:hypothetical protein [Gymnodinialimonas ulvae]|uniref:hypothetical protein n=1 Tax=Gymnodinialimonas ulvae TaxID=3126504 RepID=UPI0030B0F92F
MTELAAYAPLAEKAAALGPDDDLRLAREDFPKDLPDHMTFGGLVLDPGFARSCTGVGDQGEPFEIADRTDGFEAYAEPEGFRQMGLWLLHFLLSGRTWAGLELTHPTTRITRFYAQVVDDVPRDHMLHVATQRSYSAYEYWPQVVWRHPFADARMTPVHRVEEQDRPFFAFGWSKDADKCDFDPDHADQLILQATPEGIAAMGCLLLDMANPTLGREEVNIETPVIGFAGTQHRSIEGRLWLPNSFAFNADTLDTLKLPPTRAESRAMKAYAESSDKTI